MRNYPAKAMSLCALAFAALWGVPTFGAAEDDELIEVLDEPTRTVAAPTGEDHIEEVIVTAPPVDPFQVQSLETINQIYNSLERGGRLYKQHRFSEALPFLLAGARRGFKYAQARVGFIYQQGLDGVPQNPQAAVGWLGVAASSPTHPEIRNYFNRTWSRIPSEYHQTFQDIVDIYVERYGNRPNRVGCDLSHTAGSHIRQLTCRFEDEYLYQNFSLSDTIEGIETMTGSFPPPGSIGGTTTGTGN